MLSVIARRFARRDRTRRYPDAPATPPTAFRGMPELLVERCRGHAACAEACPSGALRVAHLANGWLWELDCATCLACGLCAEACPEQALASSPVFELAARSRDALRVRFAMSAGQSEVEG
jgi:formate hydrogenlyase subunit 6/NADH:ubiquinone oxidoreductase subunit I